jgi:fatty-acyl-CoA synthase
MTMQAPRARTFPALLDEMAARYPDRPFATDQHRTLTYRAFRAEARALAKGLHGLGVRRGDKIGLLAGNSVEWLLTDFAITMLGAVTVAFNTWWKQNELLHALSLTDISLLITADAYLGNRYPPIIAALRPEIPLLRHVVVLGSDAEDDTVRFEDVAASGNLSDEALDVLASAIQPDDVAYITFTSGSTAGAKAVQLTHGGCIENSFSIGERMHLTAEDRVLFPTGLFWSFGCVNCLFATATHGASIVLLFRFQAEEMLATIERERCTAVYTLPNIVSAIYAVPNRERFDLSRWRTGTVRSSIRGKLIEMGVPEAITSYGLTECYGMSVNSDALDPDEAKRNSGRPLPGVELSIVSPERTPLPDGEMGEIRLRGHVTPGYYKDPEATAAAIDADGWFYTGDLGVIEPDGALTYKARAKEMIKTGGIGVTPADVEQLLESHLAVRAAVVVGVPDPVREELIAALVVLEEGAAASEDELIAYCRDTAASYKVPRILRFVAEADIPLTSTGKVHRRAVQEMLTAPPATAA